MAATGGCLYVPGTVEGVKVKFLYDTGASSSFINFQTWRAILARLPPERHPELEEPTNQLRAVNGQSLSLLGKAMLRMVIDEHPVTGLVWIGDVAEEAILGLDFIEAVSYTHLTLPTKRIV